VIDFRVLGPLEVWDSERPLELRASKQRALLAILVFRRGEVLSVDVLVDALWGEEPPRTAIPALRNYVSQLRSLLGPDLLLSRGGGYVLEVAEEQVDLGRFQRLTGEGRAASGEERAAKLREALELWRGPPLADLAFEPFAPPVIGSLEELRTAALEDLMDAELALGAGAELVRELELLIAKDPLRERLRGQLMLALYRGGRQVEALDAYQEARRTLVEELGIEPSAALRELEQAILRQDPGLFQDAAPDGAALRESRERQTTATVLFSEITSMSAGGVGGGDPDELHRVSLRASHELRAAVEYHGGTVERLTGDELMAVFGIPTGHEDDVVRAARTALQLHRALASLNEALDGEFRIETRSAIATGPVTVMGEAGRAHFTGAVIALARRLAETAALGEILLDEATLSRGRSSLRAQPVEDRSLRGRLEPVGVFLLLDVLDEPPPERGPSAKLVGRRRELRQLKDDFERARSEQRCVVATVLGEAGIGKSKLAREFTSLIAETASVFIGRCISYGEGATYLPLAEIVAQATEGRPIEQVETLLAGEEDAGIIAERLVDLVRAGGGESATGEAFWAVRRFLERLAHEQPVVLLFEDIHWAEPTLLDLVEYLGQWSRGAALFLLCLARPELREERPSWGADATAIRLEPLSEEEMLELVEQVGENVPAEQQAHVAELAGGNPLFAQQLVAYADGEELAQLETVPPSLEALLSSRLDLLDEAERAVLQRAAVVGREFWHGAILHLSPPLDVPSVGRHLFELRRKGLVEPARSVFPRHDGFRFHHVLIRDVAYNSIPNELCSELHERVADWLDLQGAGQDELAGYHLEHAYRCRLGAGPPDRRARRLAADAGDRLASAGLRAAKGGDTHAASNLLTRASSLLDRADVVRRDLLTELALVLWRSSDVDGAERLLQEALDLARAQPDLRAELRARVELANLRLFRAPEGGADELLAFSREAIPILDRLGDARALGRISYAQAFVLGGLHCRYRDSEEAAERALGYFRRSGWPVTPCVQELAASLYYGPTDVQAGIQRCQALVEEADRGGEAHLLAFLGGFEAMAGRFDSARESALRAKKIYEELAWTINVSTNYASLAADIELLADNHHEAERLLDESCKRLEAWGEQAHLATQATQAGEAVYEQGRYGDALRWSEIAEGCAASDDVGAQFSWRALRAKALAHRSVCREAETLAHEAVELAAATDAVNQHANVLLSYAEVLRLGNRPEIAAGAVADAVRLLEQKDNRVAITKARSLLVELASV